VIYPSEQLTPQQRAAFVLERFSAEQRGEISLDSDYLVHARQHEKRGEELTARQKRSLRLLWPHERAEVENNVEALEQRAQQVARDVAEHGDVAREWYAQQGYGHLVAQAPNGALRQHTSSRPRGGTPAGRTSSGGTRAGHDDGPGESEQPLDRLLRALRRSYTDAYRLHPSEGGDAYLARCPCAPDAGHTMVVVDQGQHAEPLIACRFACNVSGITRMLGLDRPERIRFVAQFADALVRNQRWVRERRSS
jgi:hypothetical protein